jgi:thiamine biosynthesis lipoprotein
MLIDDIQGIGTHWWFEFPDAEKSIEYYRDQIRSQIQQFEHAYSRFLPDSQLSLLNRDRQLINPSPEMIELLVLGKEFYHKTQGYFNPAVGSILENRGYDASYSFEHQGKEEVLPFFDDFVSISPEKIQLNGQGNIDFGGYGKGYLIDKLALLFRETFGLKQFLINGGGDMSFSGQSRHEVILEHPFAQGYELGRIYLQNQSLGCSSNQKRAWRDTQTGEIHGHIINPTQLDKRVDFGAFVVASDTLTADIMATVVCILGDNIEKIKELQKAIQFEYVVVTPDQKMVVSKGFPKVRV